MNPEGGRMGHGACAACKHQRRRCDEQCVLAKYFPVCKTEDFKNVSKLFGVSNLLRILHSVEEQDRDKVAETLITEARIRRENPVHGSIAVQEALQAQIEEAEKELIEVNKKLAFCKGKKEKDQQKQANGSKIGHVGVAFDGLNEQSTMGGDEEIKLLQVPFALEDEPKSKQL